METIFQLLLSGIAMGFIYCMIAIEYTLIYNISGLMNFGHEQYIMVGAFVFAGTFATGFQLTSFPAIAGSLLCMACIGAFIATIALNPLRNLPRLYAITGTMSLSYIFRELTRLVYGSKPFILPRFMTGNITVGTAVLPLAYFYIIGVAIVFLILQYLLLTRTRVGKAMRCVSQDKEASALMGINVTQLLTFTVALSLMVCCTIGILLVPLYGVNLNMTATIGQKGFVAGIVGGFGNINGAVAEGLFVGIVEAIYTMLGGPGAYKDCISFALVVIFLMFKPRGIFGKTRDLL